MQNSYTYSQYSRPAASSYSQPAYGTNTNYHGAQSASQHIERNTMSGYSGGYHGTGSRGTSGYSGMNKSYGGNRAYSGSSYTGASTGSYSAVKGGYQSTYGTYPATTRTTGNYSPSRTYYGATASCGACGS